MPNSFLEELTAAAERNRSLLCIGLDPDPALMAIADVFEFNREIIDATKDLVCAYKPNVAFYDALGDEGHKVLRRTLEHIHGTTNGIPAIGDSKRGDVEHTSRFHARAMFDTLGFDAATINPYGGQDAVEPFLEYTDKGIFVWCRSTNPGARDIQDLSVTIKDSGESLPLYLWIATLAADWNEAGNVGLVVGAPYPEELRRVRRLCPRMPFLIPGVGAQQGPLERAVAHGVDSSGRNAIITVSRSIIYASKDPSKFAGKARDMALRIRSHINSQLRFLDVGWGDGPPTGSLTSVRRDATVPAT